MSHRYDSLELIRKKTSMSQQIAKKDQSYGEYSGAYLDDAYTLALLKAIEDLPIIEHLQTHVKFLKKFLQERRKAYFASTSSEITKLGFILGYKGYEISAKNTRQELDRLSQAPV